MSWASGRRGRGVSDAADISLTMPSRSLAERWPNLLPLAGHPVVDMPAHVIEAAATCASHAPYAPTRGLPELRAAIAAHHGVDPDRQVLITQGAMQALELVMRSFGSRAVVRAPSFFFPQMVQLAGGHCTITYDWDEYAAAVGPGTTLAIANNPVNPTGDVYRAEDIEALAVALRDSDALLVSDEAYAGLVYDDLPLLSPADHPELRERTLVLRSFSKTFGMAGWRIGYVIGPEAAIEVLATALQWQSMAINSVAQAAALAALTGPQSWIEAGMAELSQMRPLAVQAATAVGFSCGTPEGCAFLWVAVDGEEDTWSNRLARAHGIPALPGRHFHARTPHLRIPFGGPAPARRALLEHLAAITT